VATIHVMYTYTCICSTFMSKHRLTTVFSFGVLILKRAKTIVVVLAVTRSKLRGLLFIRAVFLHFNHDGILFFLAELAIHASFTRLFTDQVKKTCRKKKAWYNETDGVLGVGDGGTVHVFDRKSTAKHSDGNDESLSCTERTTSVNPVNCHEVTPVKDVLMQSPEPRMTIPH